MELYFGLAVRVVIKLKKNLSGLGSYQYGFLTRKVNLRNCVLKKLLCKAYNSNQGSNPLYMYRILIIALCSADLPEDDCGVTTEYL